LRYLYPPTDPFAIRGFENVMVGVMGALMVFVAYGIYQRRNLPEPVNPDAKSPRSAMWMWLVGATLLLLGMFWPLVWHLSLDLHLLVRIALAGYCLFEAQQAHRRRNQPPAVYGENSIRETSGDGIGLKIMAAIIVAFGVVVIGGGLWYAEFEWSRFTEWPRTTGVLVDKRISPMGARLIFEYDAIGGRSAGRAVRWGREDEMRSFLEPYRLGTSYPISYNPEDPAEVEFHLGYHWDLFRQPVAIVMLGALFAAAGLALGTPWRRRPALRR
jgi:hypothetical protein